jgi:alanine racemase
MHSPDRAWRAAVPHTEGTPGAAARPAGSARGKATLTIDLAAVAANFGFLASKLQGARCGAVVKADAYNLGLAEVAPALAAAGCRDFFVADVDEGIALGRLAPRAAIYVLNGPAAETVAEFEPHRLVPVLNDLGQVARWGAHARRCGPLKAALHVDTGMSRLGLPPDELDTLAREPRRLDGVELACVISHLACADDPDHPLNRGQLEAFRAARARLPSAPASLANSAAIFLGPEYHFDLARPGAALYGLRPLLKGPNPMRPTVRLEAPILQVHRVDSPMTVGYGASHQVRTRGRVATLPVGYADGYLRALSNRGSAFIGAIRAPVIGRVSMDLITLDVSEVPEPLARPGATVELIGAHYSIDDLAEDAGTIGYEILTSLGSRYLRRYIGRPETPRAG